MDILHAVCTPIPRYTSTDAGKDVGAGASGALSPFVGRL